MPQQFADFLLDQRHNQPLPYIIDLNRLIMLVNASSAPFTPILILGVLGIANANGSDTANQELTGERFLVVLFEVLP